MSVPAAETVPTPLAGARIREVRQAGETELVVETEHPAHGAARWLLSLHPECARLVQTFSRAPSLPRPTVFARWLQTRLTGGTVEALERRAAQVHALVVRRGAGHYRLVLEWNGVESNALLLDGEERLLQAMRHPALGRRRLTRGQPYAPPGKLRPLPADPPAHWRLPAATPERARERDRFWRQREREAAEQEARKAAAREARRRVKSLRRRLRSLQDDLAQARDAERHRRHGELLKIHRAAVVPGAGAVTVPDEFDPHRPAVTIPLDDHLDVAGNIERCFQRFRKARAAVPHLQQRIAQTGRELADLQRAAGQLADPAAALEPAARELLERHRRPARRQGRPAGARSPQGPAAPEVQSRLSADGYLIRWGRSDAANDALTFRQARGRDWWFHALDGAGAHVVVQAPKGERPPEATVREAAWLAAYYSRRRPEGEVEVAYTQRKHVRRVRKAAPGRVTYAHAHTLWVDVRDSVAAAVLQRLPEGADGA